MQAQDIIQLNHNVAKELAQKVYSDKSTLIFPPVYKSAIPGKSAEKVVKRLSEQESRVIFCKQLFENNIAFSIETPTIGKYKQKGNGTSARIDLTIYDNLSYKKISAGFEKGKSNNIKYQFDAPLINPYENNIIHIELKSGQPGEKPVNYDLEKLIREPKAFGNYFYTLESIRTNTIERLIKKFNDSLNSLNGEGYIINTPIIFYIAILNLKPNPNPYNHNFTCFYFILDLKNPIQYPNPIPQINIKKGDISHNSLVKPFSDPYWNIY